MNQVKSISRYEYRWTDVIGKGSKSTVYAGIDKQTGERVAIKHIHLGNLDQLSLWLLQNEKRVLMRLRHPNVIKLLELVENEHDCYLIFPFYGCGSLADLLKRRGGRLPEQEAMRLFSRLMNGYLHLYENGVLHRDLKPQNILLDDNSCMPVISDFGFCRLPNEELPEELTYIVGTPSYMAPQVLIKNEYSEKADVWSLGAILYEILVGEGYDEGKEVTQAMVDIRKQGLPFPRDITFNAQYLVKDMMCINPDDRLGTKDIIKRLPIQQERKQIKPIRPRNIATLDIKDTNEQHESIGTITSTTEEKYTLCTGKIEKHMPQQAMEPLQGARTAVRRTVHSPYTPHQQLNNHHTPERVPTGQTIVHIKPRTSNCTLAEVSEVRLEREIHVIRPKKFQPIQVVMPASTSFQPHRQADSPGTFHQRSFAQTGKPQTSYSPMPAPRPVKPQTTRMVVDTTVSTPNQPIRQLTPTNTVWVRRPSAM